VYWRPLGNFFHRVLFLFSGWNVLPFRIFSLVVYLVCALLVYKFFIGSGLKKSAALPAALFFAILPVHDYQTAWIAGTGETISAVLIIAAFLFYKKFIERNNKLLYGFLTILFFTAAILVKEIAFASVFIPLFYFMVNEEKNKRNISTHLLHSAAGAVVILFMLLLRFTFIGGHPFQSDHFEQGGIINYVSNFFAYIVISFIPVSLIENITGSVIYLAAAFLILILFIYIVLKEWKSIDKKHLAAYLFWYVIFIIPALPVLMRWYPFTASIGLTGALAILIIPAIRKVNRNYLIGAAIIISAAFFTFNLNRLNNWITSSRIMEEAVSSLKEIEFQKDSIVAFAVPSTYKDVPLMRLGFQQTLGFAKNGETETESFLRSNLFSDESRILVEESDSLLLFKIIYGDFSFITDSRNRRETASQNRDINYSIIRNGDTAFAKIEFIKSDNSDYIYFDGRKFKKLY
jgi:hypothetical protein